MENASESFPSVKNLSKDLYRQFRFQRPGIKQKGYAMASIDNTLVSKYLLKITRNIQKHKKFTVSFFCLARTLLKYMNFTDPGCSFNIDIVNKLVNHLRPDTLKEFERNVVLVFDEMKIKLQVITRQQKN